MMTIVVIALTTQIIIIAHIHTISCRRDSNPDSPDTLAFIRSVVVSAATGHASNSK